MKDRRRVAVVFGGASPEHDVSVISAQQLMDAVDVRALDIVPVYCNFENAFFRGADLRKINRFRPRPGGLREVRFVWTEAGPAVVSAAGRDATPIDCVLPVCHGAFGEDGRLQAFFEVLGLPAVGFSATNSALAMRKDATKAVVKSAGVDVLDHIAVRRSQFRRVEDVVAAVEARFGFPVIVKPANLGSSIGVGAARNADELGPLLAFVLKQDALALIEPQVRNLVEFNVSMIADSARGIRFSAIERPKTNAELLDFKEKYLSNPAGGAKGDITPSAGMLSLTRELNPDLPQELRAQIFDFAEKAFVALGERGAPRIDFLYDSEARRLWFNEINPIPGSYGYFLWEAADPPMLFPELIEHLVAEALRDSEKSFFDPVPEAARLFPR